MRFIIKQVGAGSDRVGKLTDFAKSPGTIIETPTAALLTQGGSVVHLTAEVLSWVFKNPQLLWLPLSNCIQLETGVKAQGGGIAKFAGLAGNISCVSLHNINEVTPAGHFELDKVPLWTKNGKKMISADRYMDVMEIFKPELILAIADGRTSLNEGFKRISKSVDRTKNMLDVCVRRYKASEQLRDSLLIGVVVGGAHSKKCEDSIKHVLTHKESLSGVALAGITDGTEDPLEVEIEKLETIFKKVAEALPTNIIRVVEGCWNPVIVLTAVEHGWDIFDGSYPLKLTNAGYALRLFFDISTNNDDLCIINLNDEKYKEDFNPILADCECLACKKHTRAYIHHLLNTREMLASVLLHIHNLHHFDQMFRHARHHIDSKSYQMYKQHITKQYELYKKSELEKKKGYNTEDQGSECIQIKKKPRITDKCMPSSAVMDVKAS